MNMFGGWWLWFKYEISSTSLACLSFMYDSVTDTQAQARSQMLAPATPVQWFETHENVEPEYEKRE
jgi:hypothetical protein